MSKELRTQREIVLQEVPTAKQTGEGDLEEITLTRKYFDSLPDYSCTIPTGTIVGKRWKRHEPYEMLPGTEKDHRWYLGEYVPSLLPDCVGIKWRRIIIDEDKGNVPGPHKGTGRRPGKCLKCGAVFIIEDGHPVCQTT